MKEIYPVPAEFKKTARTTDTEYFERYQQSIEQPDQFWAEQAQRLDWIKPLPKLKIPVLIKTILKLNGLQMASSMSVPTVWIAILRNILINRRLSGKGIIHPVTRLFLFMSFMMKLAVSPMS